MKASIFLMLIALVSGAMLPVQAGLNAKVGKAVGDPIYAALISFFVGTIGLFVYALIARIDLSQISNTTSLHWTVWLAGILGAFYVSAIIILVPRIGAALTFGLVVAGQLMLSLLLDHFGWLEVSVHTFNWKRLIGALLVVVGVLIIRSF